MDIMQKMKVAMQAKKKMAGTGKNVPPSARPNMGGLKFDSMLKKDLKKKIA